MGKFFTIYFVLLAASGCRRVSTEQVRFQTPEGFSVEVAASPERTGSLIAFTFDSFGRPVVSKERAHPTLLIDADHDGIFESQKVFSDKVTAAQGLWFEGRTLYAVAKDVAEGKAGLYRMEDKDGDDIADSFNRISTFEGSIGEHGPHDIRRAPDGTVTVMLGNHTSPPADRIGPYSPLRNYNEAQLLERYWDARGHAKGILAPGGVLVRWNRGDNSFTPVFGGLRNAYNHAYNRDGEAFTFDSDMEWDINMPWYRPVRSLHGVPGGDYGWRSGSGKLPNDFIDTLPPFHEAGRGSPTGVEFYHHNVYPQRYFDAFLEADWSRGRVLISTPRRAGASYRLASEPTEFVHAEPLNVTDIEVGPDGFLYFTMGGRDTQGGLYRIRYTPGILEKLTRGRAPRALLAVVRQPQPLSSWGHAELLKAKAAMGNAWAGEMQALVKDSGVSTDDRVQGLLILQRAGPAPHADLLAELAEDNDANVRAAAVYLAGLSVSPVAKKLVAGALNDPDPFVRRRAAEALVRQGLDPGQLSWVKADNLISLLSDPDRFVRYAARLALERLPRSSWALHAISLSEPTAAAEASVALVRTATALEELLAVFDKQVATLRNANLGVEDELHLLRAIQLTAIAYKDGLPNGQRKQLYEVIAPRFPAPYQRFNMEYARLLAYSSLPEAIKEILAELRVDDGEPQLQIHYVYCLRTIKSGWTKEQKQKLIAWFPKAAKWRGGASFTGFINFLFDSSLELLEEEEKKNAWARLPEFAPLKVAESQSRQTVPSVIHRQKGVQAYSAQEIMEFQLFDPMTTKASPERGRALFESECASCHRFGAIGRDFGPDLTTISRRFQKKDILEAILFPSKTISDQYQSWIVETKDGETLNGLIVAEDARKMVLKTGDQPRPIEVLKSNVKVRRVSRISIMPADSLDASSMEEISSLMAYLLGSAR
ncbi:MAG: HEAT repeat domain-containing protein [Bryobacterales bacterium]|nr:HEAT repeat domain-containing protein [Bryobacterales bacterium]